jgi:hypothetical protein
MRLAMQGDTIEDPYRMHGKNGTSNFIAAHASQEFSTRAQGSMDCKPHPERLTAPLPIRHYEDVISFHLEVRRNGYEAYHYCNYQAMN